MRLRFSIRDLPKPEEDVLAPRERRMVLVLVVVVVVLAVLSLLAL